MIPSTLLLTVGLLSLCVAEVFHVTPTISATQSRPSSHPTLNQYAQNISLLAGHANISLVFLEGVHNLSENLSVSGLGLNSNISMFTFQGQGVSPKDTVINLLPSASISLSDITSVHLLNIHIRAVARLEYYNINEIPGSLHIVYQAVRLVQHFQVETENVIVRSDALTANSECNFTKSVFIFTPNMTTDFINGYDSNDLGGLEGLNVDIQNCSITESLVFCTTSNCNITVDDTTIKGFSIGNAFHTVIQNSRFVGQLYIVWAYDTQNLFISGYEFQNIVTDYNIYAEDITPYIFGEIRIDDCIFQIDGDQGVRIRGIETSKIINSNFEGITTDIVFAGHLLILNSTLLGKLMLYRSIAVDFRNSAVVGEISLYASNSIDIRNCTVLGILLVFFSTTANINNCVLLGYGEIQNISATSFLHNAQTEVLISQTDKVTIENTSVSNFNFGILLDSVGSGTIIECFIQNNIIGVMSINSRLTIVNTDVIENSFGIVIPAVQLFGPPIENATGFITNSIFSGNDAIGLLLISIPSGIIITNCSFYENHGTPITAYQSIFELGGENIFRDNTAEIGGGLALFNSTVVFGPGSDTLFTNNTAQQFGGAIYIATLSILSFLHEVLIVAENINDHSINSLLSTNTLLRQSCFFLSGNESSITFTGNSATLGGIDIYGATLYTEECNLANNSVFKFSSISSNTYKISSSPTRVCFCVDNTPQCENRAYLIQNETRYPGENFTFSVVLAGYNFGRVAGSVYTNVLGRDFREVISDSQHIQSVNLMECGTLTYTLSSDQIGDPVILVLTAQEQITQGQDKTDIQTDLHNIYSKRCSENELFPCTALLTTPVYINVTLEPCPLGFKLSDICECDDKLQNISKACEIQNHIGYIRREGTVWMGADTSDNNTDVYYLHRYCPRDYCIPSQTSIALRYPDKQCSSNRSGVLCGMCQPGYSLQLGGNKCIKCNSTYLALLIVFALLGILLVALIKILDLTVTSGAINGLIFYANVVWRNNAILFSLQDRQSVGHYIITVPIAWINLDFGIETCFSENLDQLTKTGLQFVFPVYIWCIAGLIIVISHYSTRATKLFGNNSVAVLATLFLLSYGKIFRNITDVFTFADVIDSNDTLRKVWSLDGNVRYGITPSHAVLIVVALLFLILFLLPFTFALLFVPFLRAKSHLRPLHWINALKPFFDTYYGPFKDKKQHQVWTGILLISRVVILIVFASTSTYSPNASILLMTLISILLLMYSSMVSLLYKNWSLSLVENLYILNLAMLGGTSLFYQLSTSTEDQQHNELNPVTTISVVIALFSFACTVIIYTAKQLMSIEKIRSCLKREEGDEDADQSVSVARLEVTKPTVHVIELKEEEEYNPTMFREELLDTLN